MMNARMKRFFNRLEASPWMYRMRWSFYFLTVGFWVLASCAAICLCSPANLKFVVPFPSPAAILDVTPATFVYSVFKIALAVVVLCLLGLVYFFYRKVRQFGELLAVA